MDRDRDHTQRIKVDVHLHLPDNPPQWVIGLFNHLDRHLADIAKAVTKLAADDRSARSLKVDLGTPAPKP